MLIDLPTGFVELKKGEVIDTVTTRIKNGEDALAILEDARRAMIVVGEQFQEGTLFLAQMLLAAEMFKEIAALLQPGLDKARPAESLGSVVLATPRGDIHDLGKNIFATMLSVHGFEVHDLGVDVEPSLVVEKVKEVRPAFVGFSALITTAFASMKETAELFEGERMRDSFKLMVGGGVTNPMLKDHVGADFQSTDATAGVNYCLRIMEGAQASGPAVTGG